MDMEKELHKHLLKCWQGGKIKTYADGGVADDDERDEEKRLVQLRAKNFQGTITPEEDKERLKLQVKLGEIPKYAPGGFVNKFSTTGDDDEDGIPDANQRPADQLEVKPTEEPTIKEEPPIDIEAAFRESLLKDYSPIQEAKDRKALLDAQRSVPNVIGQGVAGLGDAFLASVGQKGGGLEGILTREGKSREELGQRFTQGRQTAVGLMSAQAQQDLAKAQADEARALNKRNRQDALAQRYESAPSVKLIRSLDPVVSHLQNVSAAQLTDNDLNSLVDSVLALRKGSNVSVQERNDFIREEMSELYKAAQFVPYLGNKILEVIGSANKVPGEIKQQLLDELFTRYNEANRQAAPAREAGVELPSTVVPTPAKKKETPPSKGPGSSEANPLLIQSMDHYNKTPDGTWVTDGKSTRQK